MPAPLDSQTDWLHVHVICRYLLAHCIESDVVVDTDAVPDHGFVNVQGWYQQLRSNLAMARFHPPVSEFLGLPETFSLERARESIEEVFCVAQEVAVVREEHDLAVTHCEFGFGIFQPQCQTVLVHSYIVAGVIYLEPIHFADMGSVINWLTRYHQAPRRTLQVLGEMTGLHNVRFF